MNRALILNLMRQRLTSPLRAVLLAMAIGFPLLVVSFVHGSTFGSLGSSLIFVLILGAGMIGQDTSAGVLQLLFARPVTRSEYVVSRWLAVALGASFASLLQIGLASLILVARGHPVSAHDLLLVAGTAVLGAFGASAVLAFLSALAPGLGDLGLYLVFNVVAFASDIVGKVAPHLAQFSRVAEEIHRFLEPKLELMTLLTAGGFSWFAITSYLSTVTLCLALAIVVVNRRELSYASG